MRSLVRLGALAAMLLTAWVGSSAWADSAAANFDDGHQYVVVTFNNDPYRPTSPAGTTGRRYAGDSYGLAQRARSDAHRVASTYSLSEVASWPIRALQVHCVVYRVPDGRPVPEVLASLARDPRITLAQPLQQFHTLTSASAPAPYNDPLFALQSNLVSLGIGAAHQHSQGAGVRIGLVDTGVDAGHPDLRDRIAVSRSFIGAHAANAGALRHGTAMAGLIAAVANNNVGIVGIAPLARIEVFEACWQLQPNSDAAACNTFTLAQAIAAALDARLPLINLSIAGPADPLLTALVQSGLKRGVIVIGAGTEADNSFPTNIEGVIGVGDSQRGRSNSTLQVPATHVLTLRPDSQYDFESGTSVAAAEMSGMVALLLGTDAHLSGDAVIALLKQDGPVDLDRALVSLESQRGGGRLARAAH